MMFSMLEGMPVLLCWRCHSFVLRCFDATRCLVSNKLEFAQFGAHLQKLWQFWFPWSILCFRGSGLRLASAVVPRSTGVVPPKHSSGSTAPRAVVPLVVFGRSTAVVPGYYRLDSRPMFFVSGFTVLSEVVVAVVPLQAVVPPLLPR